jgi:outer membrane protein assembly factor BamB
MIMRYISLCFLFAVAFGLAACGDKDVILPGERSSILDDIALPAIDADALAENAGIGDQLPNIIYGHAGLLPSHTGGHLALDLPLQQQWAVRIGEAADFGTLMTAPVASKDTVFAITPDTMLTALDIADGSIRWSLPLENRMDTTQPSISGGLAYADDRIYAHAGGDVVVSLDAATGEELWRKKFDLPILGGPTVAGQFLAITDFDGRLIVLNAANGDLLWSRIGNPESTRVLGASSPAIAKNELIFAGNDAEISALDISQSGFLWGDNLASLLPRTALDQINAIVGHPVHAGGMVYVGSISGRFAAFNTQTGSPAWEMILPSQQMPWIAGKSIFVVSTKGRVYALRRTDGALRWITSLPGAIPLDVNVSDDPIRHLGPIVAGGKVIVVDQDGRAYFLDPDTGAILNNLSLSGRISAPPIVSSGTFILLDDSGRLSAYR